MRFALLDREDLAVLGVEDEDLGEMTLLIESAKLCGVEPRGYLREATLRAVRNPGTVTLARDLKSPES